MSLRVFYPLRLATHTHSARLRWILLLLSSRHRLRPCMIKILAAAQMSEDDRGFLGWQNA